jgi:Short C-terminal domain
MTDPNLVDQLKNLANLYGTGAITADEFARAKARLLGTDSEDETEGDRQIDVPRARLCRKHRRHHPLRRKGLRRLQQGREPTMTSQSRSGVVDDEAGLGDVPHKEDCAEATESRQLLLEPLAMISTYLRGDRKLSPDAAIVLEQVIKVTYDQLRKKD